jgi:glycosyltransferase involved in cell wall biosynthesis
MSDLRILIVSQYFWPEDFRINDIVMSLVEKGAQVDVLTGKPNYPDGHIYEGYQAWDTKYESWEGVSVFRVPMIPRGVGRIWQLALNYLSFIFFGSIFGLFFLRGRQYDVVFVYGVSPLLSAIPGILLARLKRRKLVLWVQDLWPDSLSATGYIRNLHVLRLVEGVVRWIYGCSDLILVQSRAFIVPVSEQAPGKAVLYYPNSVADAFWKPPSTLVDLPDVPALNEGFAVLFAGNIGKAQAVEVIVEAAALLKEIQQIRFVVFGRGSRFDWMCEQVKAQGLSNLHLPGRFPLETMPSLMRKAGALLVTLSDEPIFAKTVPNKIQAYLAVGRPIIACLNGEGAYLVEMDAKAGLSAPAQDAQALATAVLELYKMSPEDREKLGANGQCYFMAHFHHDTLVDELMGHLSAMS